MNELTVLTEATGLPIHRAVRRPSAEVSAPAPVLPRAGWLSQTYNRWLVTKHRLLSELWQRLRLPPLPSLFLLLCLLASLSTLAPAHAASLAGLTTPPAAATCGPAPGGAPKCGAGPASQGNTSGTNQAVGNPINVINGNKYQREDDLPALPGVMGLEIVRHYNSRYSGIDVAAGVLGHGWKLSYETDLYAIGNTIQIVQADGTRIIFNRNTDDPSLCSSPNPTHGSLQIEQGRAGPRYLWRWTDGRVLRFDSTGKLEQIVAPTGEFVSLQHDARGLLVEVTDPQGRRLVLQYPSRQSAAGFRGVVRISSPVGTFGYTYGSALPAGSSASRTSVLANLVRVDYPDQSGSRTYHYEDGHHPTYLTGISVAGSNVAGGSTQRIGSYAYDRDGRAVLSVRGPPARLQAGADGKPLHPATLVAGTGIGQVTLDFATPGTTILTNSLGQRTTYRHAIIGGEQRLLEVRGAGCSQCGQMNMRYDYDQLGRLTGTTTLSPQGVPLQTVTTTLDAQGRPLATQRLMYIDGKAKPAQLQVRYAYAAQSSDITGPTLIARPSVVPGQEHRLQIDYNRAGQPVRVAETGFIPALDAGVATTRIATTPITTTRITTYQYQNIGGKSLLTQTDGPLANGPTNTPADSDITRYSWTRDGTRIAQITYPAGRSAAFTYEDETSNPTNSSNPNNPTHRLHASTAIDGVTTTYAYNYRGELTQTRRAGILTSVRHDVLGRTTAIQSATDQGLQFSFGDTRGPSSMTDAQNNRITLTRDTEDTVREARLLEPDGTLAQQPLRFNDDLQQPSEASDPNRDAVLASVRQSISATETATTNGNSSDGNLARPDPIASPYAVLQRFIAAASSDDSDGSDDSDDSNDIALGLSAEPATPSAPARSSLRHATDATGAITTYRNDDFGNLIEVRSPTTGTTHYTYDAADHLVARSSQDGSHATYTRDGAGRVIAVQTANAARQIDEQAHITWGKTDRPASISYLAGAEQFGYDDAARLITHTQQIDGHQYTLRYRYDSQGRLAAKTLPTGQTLDYRYRASLHARAGLLESVWLDGVDNDTAQRLTGGLLARPIVQNLNPATDRYRHRTFQFGNGLTSTTTIDASGRVTQAGNAQVGQTQLRYGVANTSDAASTHPNREAGGSDSPEQVSTLQPVHAGQRAAQQTTQALMGKLHGVSVGWGSGLADAPPVFLADGEHADHAIGFDALGRQTSQGRLRLLYDSLGRLAGIDQISDVQQPIARYRYNLFGQRIAKTVTLPDGSTRTTHYMYDGNWLVYEAEVAVSNTDKPATSRPKTTHTATEPKQYVWLDATPIAVLQQGQILAIHTDHRNAPLALTDEARRVVWQASVADGLHATPASQSGFGSITFNLRGSNQYFDGESGLHYNTQRYYDPVAGRYMSPDPLGLAVGPNLYAFALGQPQVLSDPLGLAPAVATDWSKASYNDKLIEIIQRSIPMLPGEIGTALQKLVQPENIAMMAAFAGAFATAQLIPGVNVLADAVLLGYGSYLVGKGIYTLIQAIQALNTNVLNARCDSDLTAAAIALANQFVTGTGEVAGGLAGVYGSWPSGGFGRIAAGLQKLNALWKGRSRVGSVGQGNSAQPPSFPATSTEGLAFRQNLPKHLAGPDGFTKTGQLSGTHNLDNAKATLDAVEASYSVVQTTTLGISELSYNYLNPANGKRVYGSKTVYDPAVISDTKMLELAQRAARDGFENYLKNPTQRVLDTNQGGVNFRTYINIDPNTGVPYVGNVHPIK